MVKENLKVFKIGSKDFFDIVVAENEAEALRHWREETGIPEEEERPAIKLISANFNIIADPHKPRNEWTWIPINEVIKGLTYAPQIVAGSEY